MVLVIIVVFVFLQNWRDADSRNRSAGVADRNVRRFPLLGFSINTLVSVCIRTRDWTRRGRRDHRRGSSRASSRQESLRETRRFQAMKEVGGP